MEAVQPRKTSNIELTPAIPSKVLPDKSEFNMNLSMNSEYDIDTVPELNSQLTHYTKPSYQVRPITELSLKPVDNEKLSMAQKLSMSSINTRIRLAKTVCIPSENLHKFRSRELSGEEMKSIPEKQVGSFLVAIQKNPANNSNDIIKLSQVAESIIQNETASIEAVNNRLANFLDKKMVIEKKYKEMMHAVDSEELAEIKIRINTETDSTKIKGILEEIKDAYLATKNLIEQQRIIEESELLKQYENEIKSDM